MSHEHDINGSCCQGATVATQNLEEMDFERGVWDAALYNNIPRLSVLLSKHSPDVLDSSGYTALHYAAREGHIEACKVLLESGASLNIQTKSLQATPLHRAASKGHAHIVKLLLKHRADMTLMDCDGRTALHRAAAEGHSECITALLNACPDLKNGTDLQGQTPNELALRQHPEVAHLFD